MADQETRKLLANEGRALVHQAAETYLLCRDTAQQPEAYRMVDLALDAYAEALDATGTPWRRGPGNTP